MGKLPKNNPVYSAPRSPIFINPDHGLMLLTAKKYVESIFWTMNRFQDTSE